MIRRFYTFPIIVVLVVLTWALCAQSEDGPIASQSLSAEELAVLGGAEAPKTIEEQVQDVITDDGDIVVRSEDGRTVLQMEGEPDDEFTLSFTSVRDGVMAHVQLGKGGLKHRFTLVKPEGNDTPIYLDLKGPAVNGGYGVKLTLRF